MVTDVSNTAEPRVVVRNVCERPRGAPLLIATPAWRNSGDYDDLIAALSDDLAVIVLEVDEPDNCREHPLHQFDHFAEVATGMIAPHVDGRPFALVGASSDGVIAHEIGRRLAERSLPIAFVALVDTFYPGRPMLLWTGRWDRYRGMLKNRAIGEVVGQLRTAVRVRRSAVIERIGAGRRPANRDRAEPTGPERIPGSNVPNGIRLHEPVSSGLPLVLYVASNTLQSGTEKPWRELEPQLETVQAAGRHGSDLILAPYVDDISHDLSRRLCSAKEPHA